MLHAGPWSHAGESPLSGITLLTQGNVGRRGSMHNLVDTQLATRTQAKQAGCDYCTEVNVVHSTGDDVLTGIMRPQQEPTGQSDMAVCCRMYLYKFRIVRNALLDDILNSLHIMVSHTLHLQ